MVTFYSGLETALRPPSETQIDLSVDVLINVIVFNTIVIKIIYIVLIRIIISQGSATLLLLRAGSRINE